MQAHMRRPAPADRTCHKALRLHQVRELGVQRQQVGREQRAGQEGGEPRTHHRACADREGDREGWPSNRLSLV